MEKKRLDDDPEVQALYYNFTDKTPILGKSRKQKQKKLRSKCYCLSLVTLLILAIVFSSLLIVLQNVNFHHIVPDPKFHVPPSYMPMGLYKEAAVISTGLPCAQVGVDVLKRGGNVVDSAIATLLCDGALCPQCNGLGGGFIMTIYNATTKKILSVNARETAPAAATSDMFVKNPGKSTRGGMAIGIPGALKGYSTIYNLYGGGVSWESLFEPTIQFCEEGMEVSLALAASLNHFQDLVKDDPLFRETIFINNTEQPMKAGDTYKLLKLAETLKIIAREGADALYNGSLTSGFVNDIQQLNGIITEEDMANYKVDIEESFPVKLKNGYTLHVGPPPSSGLILAYILRILDGMLPAPNAGLDAHRIVEAFKFAYGERSRLGDKKFVNVSKIYDNVNSDSYIENIQNKMSDNFTSLDPKYYGADFYVPDDHGTSNIVMIDSMGNTAVVTSTINTNFGTGRISPSTGIILNNQMDDFSIPGVNNFYGIPSSPANFIEPGKRPMSSMCPSIITDENGDLVLAMGAAGGAKITVATAYLTALKLWYNKSLKEALDEPRFYHQLIPMVINYELGVTRDVIQKLKDIGHPVNRLPHKRGSAATAIGKSSLGMIEAMPDFRRAGNASGY